MKRFIFAGFVLAIILISLGLLLIRGGAEPEGDAGGDSPETGSAIDGENTGPSAEGDAVDHRMKSRKVERRFRKAPPSGSDDVPDEFVTKEGGERAVEGGEGADGEDPNRPWKDPVNKRVLGDKRWMAEVTPEMQQRIEDHLDRKLDNPEDRRLQNLDRNAAVMAVYKVVKGCYDDARANDPSVTGRVSVLFDFSTANGEGRVHDPTINKIWKLNESPEFLECFYNRSNQLRFEARTEGTSMTVEYPYWFGDDE